MPTLQRAEQIAAEAHSNQKDKQGLPYINHIHAVMNKVEGERLKTIAALHDLLQNPDFKNEEILQKFTATVHGIKSALANIGESSLSSVANKLEQAGRARNTGQIEASGPEFLKNLCALSEKFEPKQDEDNADEDIEALRDKLLAIQERCAEYNRKGALELLSAIKNCSKETRAALDSITEYVLHSNFDEAGNAAATYAATLGGG